MQTQNVAINFFERDQRLVLVAEPRRVPQRLQMLALKSQRHGCVVIMQRMRGHFGYRNFLVVAIVWHNASQIFKLDWRFPTLGSVIAAVIILINSVGCWLCDPNGADFVTLSQRAAIQRAMGLKQMVAIRIQRIVFL